MSDRSLATCSSAKAWDEREMRREEVDIWRKMSPPHHVQARKADLVILSVNTNVLSRIDLK